MEKRHFFPKNERLFLRKDINRLFSSGQTFVFYPLRIIYLHDNCDKELSHGVSLMVSVPKKKFRQAVKRNRIKRIIRESFRLNKNETTTLCKQKEKKLHIAFLYIGNELKPYVTIEKAVQKALKRIEETSPLI